MSDLYNPTNLLPVGMVTPYMGSSAPDRWLICDGATFSAATYPALSALLGGTTLPNLKGRVVVGRDAADTDWDTLGETRGAKTHTLTIAELAVHTHVQDTHGHNNFAVDDGPGGAAVGNRARLAGGAGAGFATAQVTATNQNTGSGTAHNNIQPSFVMNYIIRAS